MVTYYDDRSVLVTSTAVQVDGRTFPLAEISLVWHRRGRPSWRVLAGRGAIGAGIIVPLVAAGLGVALGLTLDTSLTVTIAIVGASVLIGLAVGPVADILFEFLDRSYTRGSRRMEIWVRWRGEPVQLLDTGDALRFGKIYRALQRAMEFHQPVGHRPGRLRRRPRPGPGPVRRR